jgi:hypothetical protein
VNLTWQTITGLTQWQRFISERSSLGPTAPTGSWEVSLRIGLRTMKSLSGSLGGLRIRFATIVFPATICPRNQVSKLPTSQSGEIICHANNYREPYISLMSINTYRWFLYSQWAILECPDP